MTQPRQPLSSLTQKQQLILEHIFRYRYLTTKHLQILCSHKDKRRVQIWLNDLVAKECIYRIYNPKEKLSGKPAIYYLATPGIRYLRGVEGYLESELQNRYKDRIRTKEFIDHCLLIADCAVNLQESSNDTKTYTWLTQADLSTLDDESPEALYLRKLQPHLYFTKRTKERAVSYAVEHMHARLPHARLRSRLKKLLEFESYEWLGDGQSPSTLIMCDELTDLIYVKRRMRYLIAKYYKADRLDVRVATTDRVRQIGISGEVWEMVIAD